MRKILFILPMFIGFSVVFGMKRNPLQGVSVLPSSKMRTTWVIMMTVDKKRYPNVAEVFRGLDGIEIESLEEVSDISNTKSPDAKVDGFKEESASDKEAEIIALKELAIMGTFSELAYKMGKDPITDDHTTLISLAHDLKATYENFLKENERYMDFIKAKTDFYFCCALVAYYLCEDEVGKDFAIWFKKIFQKDMTKENAIELLKTAPGEEAYFFLESIKDRDDAETL